MDDRLTEHVGQPRGQAGILVGGEIAAQDGELVAAHPGDQVTLTDLGLEPPGGGDQDGIPGDVAVGVVDRLEARET